MVTKISLNVPADTLKELTELAEFYKQSVEDVILTTLDTVGFYGKSIIDIGKEYKIPLKLQTVMSNVLSLSQDTYYSVHKKILDLLKVGGLYTTDDIEIDLEEVSMHFNYVPFEGCNLLVDEFSITLEPGVKMLRAYSMIDTEKVEKRSLEKLKEIIKDTEMTEPHEFYELESYDFTIDDSMDEFWILEIACDAEYFSDFPNIKAISKIVKRIYKKAGINAK